MESAVKEAAETRLLNTELHTKTSYHIFKSPSLVSKTGLSLKQM